MKLLIYVDYIKFYYDGSIIKTYKELLLTKNEKIVILSLLPDDYIINGIKGPWAAIEIVINNKQGFCLYEDLESNKKNSKKKENLKIQYFTPTISNLRFRETPTLDGKFIRMLKQDEKLELIEKGKEEAINNVKGTWVKVKTEKEEVGWCFYAYLELYDESKKK